VSTTNHSNPSKDLWELFRLACDNVGSPADWQHLNALLLESKAVRSSYLAYVELHAELRWLFCDKADAIHCISDDAMVRTSLAAEPVSAFPTVTSVPTNLIGRLSQRLHILQYPWTFGIASLAVAAGFWTFWAYLIGAGRSDLLSRPHEANVVATYWTGQGDRQSAADEQTLRAGEALKIERGLVHLELKSGATLLVEGPAEWSIEGNNRAALRLGRLIAHVPQRAIGFVLETPATTVVDLGTEFDVTVLKDESTEVEVLKGRVRLYPGPLSSQVLKGAVPTYETLTAGDARRIEKHGDKGAWISRKVAPSKSRLLGTSSESSPREIAVQGTFASSTFPSGALNSDNLIGGRGLKDGAHTAEMESGVYWHTEFGRVRGEFVSFYLGRPYQLTAMKVWNYNQPEHTGRGIKQADIYISDKGFGDPLKNPDQWRKIISKQAFTLATGRSDYNQPDVVPFEKVEAKFVAIVINEAHGEGARTIAGTSTTCAGLSEVQFWGIPLNKK
jgi:hypothetical protein